MNALVRNFNEYYPILQSMHLVVSVVAAITYLSLRELFETYSYLVRVP